MYGPFRISVEGNKGRQSSNSSNLEKKKYFFNLIVPQYQTKEYNAPKIILDDS